MKTLQKSNLKKSIAHFAFALLLLSFSLPTIGQTDSTNRGQITSKTVEKKEKPESEIKTLFGNNKAVHGGYGCASAAYSEFNGQGALLVGARGGWIINHTVSIGFGGYGMTNNLYFNDILTNERVTLNGGYGGLVIELYAFPKQPIHLAFPVLIGAGGMVYSKDIKLTNIQAGDPEDNFDYLTVDDDAFFVIEPGVELEMNVLRNFRVALGVSYRYLSDVNLLNTKSDAFDGMASSISFKFGKF